jgi:putative transposase
VDTDGRGLTLENHPARIRERDGAPRLMRMSRCRWPFVQLAFIDSGYARGYAGDCVASATAIHWSGPQFDRTGGIARRA